ncbi:MAG: hypothetical protein WBC91_14275 [Phototrophicaceae bacterium]
MSESNEVNALSLHIKPLDNSNWGESVNAMHDYLAVLKEHAGRKAEAAEEKVAEREEDLEAMKLKRRKRRNYGTRTGIVLEDGTDTHFEL